MKTKNNEWEVANHSRIRKYVKLRGPPIDEIIVIGEKACTHTGINTQTFFSGILKYSFSNE